MRTQFFGHGVVGRLVSLGVVMAVAVTITACGSTSSPTSSGAVRVATVPDSAVVRAGYLTYCSDIPYPPAEFYGPKGDLQGYEIELGNEMAARLGLRPVWVNSVFDTLIEALTSGKCDALLTAIAITPARNKQIAFIPYSLTGLQVLTQKGDPHHLGDPSKDHTLLCGHRIETGTGGAWIDQVPAIDQECTAAGKAPMISTTVKLDNTAIEDVQTDKTDGYVTGSQEVAYLVYLHPTQFQVGGGVIKGFQTGIGITKADTTLQAAIEKALLSTQSDGTYQKIFAKWNMSAALLTPSQMTIMP